MTVGDGGDYATYRDYLLGPEWDARRRRALRDAEHRCQDCGRDDRPLDVHHRTYRQLGRERRRDLVALCRSCHDDRHARESSTWKRKWFVPLNNGW